MGHAVAQLVEALRYKPEGRGFDSRWCHWKFHWHNPSGRIMALGSTQPLTEMITRNISWGVKAAGAYGWQPYHLHVSIVLKSGSLNLLEHSGPVQASNGIALPLLLLIYCIHRFYQSDTECRRLAYRATKHSRVHSGQIMTGWDAQTECSFRSKADNMKKFPEAPVVQLEISCRIAHSVKLPE